MSKRHIANLLCWLVLIALAMLECASSFLPLPHGLRPLLVVLAAAMAVMVALVYMRLLAGPDLVRVFAIASLFWLTVLLGLSAMDPITRAVYGVSGG